ncbi:MAG: MBL fold metallo-hydrolase, partial [Lachnospiraceae bacterium]|nr:MBL fold metallo-hydrolase [Lachnospiraceae bacterium]
MKIINLIENTEGGSGCAFAHGLSFFIETGKHKLLVDLGPSDETLKNAEKLGIDLRKVDIVILSHGHYDHSGGIMPFSEINNKAIIYMQKNAVDDYYSDDGIREDRERYRYIGIDKKIAELPQVRFIDGDHTIDDELRLFTIDKRSHKLPFTNASLKLKVGDEYIQDEFSHEHYLLLNQNGKKILISGCAHNGILS